MHTQELETEWLHLFDIFLSDIKLPDPAESQVNKNNHGTTENTNRDQ
jgi:hypothetical protein